MQCNSCSMVHVTRQSCFRILGWKPRFGCTTRLCRKYIVGYVCTGHHLFVGYLLAYLLPACCIIVQLVGWLFMDGVLFVY